MNFNPDPQYYAVFLAIMSGVGALVSWAATIIPYFNTWFAALTNQNKQLFMLGVGVVASIVTVGLSCGGVLTVVACTDWTDALIKMGGALLFYIIGNQSVDRATPKPQSVKDASVAGDTERAARGVPYK